MQKVVEVLSQDTKVCNTCSEGKPLQAFRGNRNTCKKCNQAKKQAWAEAKGLEYKALNAKKRMQYHETMKTISPEYLQKAREVGRLWRQNNKDKANYLCNKYRLSKAKRTPSWLTEEDLWLISEAYHLATLRSQMTGLQWEVDHVYPLRGKQVSGLHVPTNLQVITADQNRRKNNRYESLA